MKPKERGKERNARNVNCMKWTMTALIRPKQFVVTDGKWRSEK
jgi:hypothetical protein